MWNKLIESNKKERTGLISAKNSRMQVDSIRVRIWESHNMWMKYVSRNVRACTLCVCVWTIYNVHHMYKTLTRTRRRRETRKERKRRTFIPLFAHFRKRGKDRIFAHFAGDFRKASLFLEKSGNPEISGNVASLTDELYLLINDLICIL